MTIDEAFEKIDELVNSGTIEVKEWDRFIFNNCIYIVSEIENDTVWLLPCDGSQMIGEPIAPVLYRKKSSIECRLQRHWLEYGSIISIADIETWNHSHPY